MTTSDATHTLTDSDYRALSTFRHALRVFLHFSEDACRAAGIAPAQHQLLLAIRGWDDAEPPSIGDVAERLQLRHNSAVELVQRAKQGGWVESTTDASDARLQRLSITPAGRRVLAALTLLHRDELRRFRTEMNDVLRELD
jgi:DNA-binding MarR family transcriptional regulator